MNYLSPGWYPDRQPVDADSSDFKFVLAWLSAKIGAPAVVVRDRSTSGFIPPDGISVTKDGKTATVDAVMTFYYPTVSLVDLQRAFGEPLAAIAFTKPVPPPPPVVPPPAPNRLVGDPQGNGIYNTVAGDTSPDGTVTEQDGHTFIKVVRQSFIGFTSYWMLVE